MSRIHIGSTGQNPGVATVFKWVGSRLGAGLIVAFTGAFAPIPAFAETLADALSDAYKNSGLLEQNRALLRAADEDVAQAKANLRPIINWSAETSYIYSRSVDFFGNDTVDDSGNLDVGLTADLLLYDFGRSKFQIEATKETVLATRQTLLAIEQQVLFRAVRAYMNVQRNIEIVALRRNNLRLLREELRAVRNRFEVGEVTRTDVAQAEARLASARSGLANAQRDLAQAKEEFVVAVGRPPGSLKSPGKPYPISYDQATAKRVATQQLPDIRRFKHELSAAEMNIRAAKAAMRPTVNLTGQLGVREEIGGSDFSRNGSIGVEVTGPIYRGGALNSIRRQAIAQRDATIGELRLATLDVRQNVGDAYAALRAARQALTSSREQVRAARVAFEGVREEARLGARTTLDILDAEQVLLNAQADLISANADIHIAAYNIIASVGQLTTRELNLDVLTYDPAAYYNLAKDAPSSISPQGRKLDRVLRALGKD